MTTLLLVLTQIVKPRNKAVKMSEKYKISKQDYKTE